MWRRCALRLVMVLRMSRYRERRASRRLGCAWGMRLLPLHRCVRCGGGIALTRALRLAVAR